MAYAGGKQSNWLTDSQINFAKDNLSTDRGNKLEAQLRDAVINGLTTRAQNHEKRLQAFAQSTGYPNLTPEQTSFSDLLSTKHSNQLTADMRNGLLTRLTYAVTNHEMRLRALEKPTATPTKVMVERLLTTVLPKIQHVTPVKEPILEILNEYENTIPM